MPNGYTAPIYEGKEDFTARDYMLRAINGFGLMLDFRDSSGYQDPAILLEQKYEPSSYYVSSLQKAKDKHRQLWDASIADLKTMYEQYVDKKIEFATTYNERARAMQERYEAIIADVEQMQADTKFMQDVKEGSLRWLYDSLKFDCIYTSMDVLNFEEWLGHEFKGVKRDIEYYTKKLEEDRKRFDEKQAYAKEFLAALETLP